MVGIVYSNVTSPSGISTIHRPHTSNTGSDPMATVDELVGQKGKTVYTITATATVLEATREMNFRKIGALVVTCGEGKVVGMITERDVMRKVVAEERSPSEVRVSEIMTHNVICIRPETHMNQASEVMREKHIRHLPVCDEAGHLLGMVSIGDVNAYHATHQAETIGYLNDYIYGRV